MTISLEQDLRDRIDALAAKNKRSRSNWVVAELEKRVEVLESFSGAGAKPNAPADGPSTTSTRYSAGGDPG